MIKNQIKIVCLGDSITKGRFSYNWVKQLSDEFKGKNIRFFNLGKNRELAFNALNRVDKIIPIQPDYIIILLGTNDVFATLRKENTKRYIRLEKLPRQPTIEWYVENIGKIINHLKTNTSAKIAIITLPIIGEDLNNIANKTVDKYNTELTNLSKQNELGCLDMNQKMIEFLDQLDPINPVPLQNYRSLILKSIWRKYFLF